MISGVAVALLKEWYREAWMLGIILLLMGFAVMVGGHPEAGTVYPVGSLSWILAVLGALVFSVYVVLHAQWISNYVGHQVDDELGRFVLKVSKVFTFYLVMIAVSLFLSWKGMGWLALVLWLVLMFYPIAVAVDDVGELDNMLSSLESWKRDPLSVLEFFLVGVVLLLTSYALEVYMGFIGLILSILLTVLFTLPFLVTILSVSYLLRYPLTRSSLKL